MRSVTAMGAFLLLSSVFYVFLIQTVQTEVFQEQFRRDPDHPDQCYDSVANAHYKIGDVWSRPGRCLKITCAPSNTDPDFLLILGMGCNHASSFPANCKLSTPSLLAVFPDCCPTLDCHGEPEGPITQVG